MNSMVWESTKTTTPSAMLLSKWKHCQLVPWHFQVPAAKIGRPMYSYRDATSQTLLEDCMITRIKLWKLISL